MDSKTLVAYYLSRFTRNLTKLLPRAHLCICVERMVSLGKDEPRQHTWNHAAELTPSLSAALSPPGQLEAKCSLLREAEALSP